VSYWDVQCQRNGVGVLRGCAIAYAVRDHSMGKLIYRSRKRKKSWRRQPESKRSIPADVEVWTDEHLGLSRCCRMWVPKGNNTRCMVFSVHPQSGETYWWILPKVNINLFNRVLADFAILALARTSKSFWRWIKPVGIQVRK